MFKFGSEPPPPCERMVDTNPIDDYDDEPPSFAVAADAIDSAVADVVATVPQHLVALVAPSAWTRLLLPLLPLLPWARFLRYHDGSVLLGQWIRRNVVDVAFEDRE